MADNFEAKDLETAEWLNNQFRKVEYTRESPSSGLARSRHARAIRMTIPLAVAASIAGVVLTVWPVGTVESDAAWATEPIQTSPSDVSAIRDACQEPLNRGLGALEGSGMVNLSGEPGDEHSIPTTEPAKVLPTDMIVDRRKDAALALFEDSTTTVVCMAKFDGHRWKDQGVSLVPKNLEKNPALIFAGEISWLHGTTVSYQSGRLPKGKRCASFELPDGKRAIASCNSTSYAIWHPNDISFEGVKVKFF